MRRKKRLKSKVLKLYQIFYADGEHGNTILPREPMYEYKCKIRKVVDGIQ